MCCPEAFTLNVKGREILVRSGEIFVHSLRVDSVHAYKLYTLVSPVHAARQGLLLLSLAKEVCQSIKAALWMLRKCVEVHENGQEA